MHSNHTTEHHPDTQTARSVRRVSVSSIIGRLALIVVLGLAFVGYLTPSMRIQWANLMTLCGF